MNLKRTPALVLGLFLCMHILSAQNTYPVRFRFETVYFPENFASVRLQRQVDPAELVEGRYIRYVQFKNIPGARERAVLESAGVSFLGYVPFGVYLCAIPQGFDLAAFSDLEPRSISPVQPEWKLARTLQEKPYATHAVHGDAVDINVQLYPFMAIEKGADICAKRGLTVLQQGRSVGFLQLRVPMDLLDEIAAWPMIRYLELLPPPGEPEDVNGRAIHRSNLLDVNAAGGLKLDGAGVSVLVRDDGPLGPHIDFQGRLINISTESGAADGTHGDGVGGVMASAGNLNPNNKGMAAGATVYATDYTPEFQDTTLPLHVQNNVTITNSSYSNGCNTGYTLSTIAVDQQMFDYPTLMHVFSGGNSNGNDCGYGAGNQWGNITGGHKMGKNSIATANLNAASVLENSSSRGPAHDGRLKPDISAHGQGQISNDPNHGYQTFGGTSAAAPGIAGCLAQLTQGYKEKNGTEPPAALLKAALLNTANEIGNVGPDYKFGWGVVNTYRAWQLLDAGNYLEAGIDQGAVNTHNIQIPFGTRLAKIMIYWAEPAAAENTSRALINDLDLTVASPGGAINLPWLLNPTPVPALLDAPATRGRDSLNNVEQVVIENPAAGAYTVTVQGFEVPLGPQQYYIVWEFYNDDVKITYPAGGEGIAPGEVVRIHWDAYGTATNFTLRYSTDGAQTFFPITTVTGEKRSFDWTAPATISGQVYVTLIRGSKRDTTDFPLSIVPIPLNLQIEKVCPDSMTLSFSEVNDTLSYTAYLLGDRYMEAVATADTTVISFPIADPQSEKWVAVAASHNDGLLSRRTNAIRWEGGLKNCPQPNDVALTGVQSPGTSAIITCGASTRDVSIRVANQGVNPISGATLSYQLNNETPITETLPDIAPDTFLTYTFQTPLSFTQNGQAQLAIWSSYGVENYFFNDTIRLSLPVIVNAVSDYFTQEFEGQQFPPTGWAIGNPDDAITWVQTPQPVIGPDGVPGRSLFLNCYAYASRGQEDFIYVTPLDLTNLNKPALRFEVAHAQYDDTYVEKLRVEAYPGCDFGQEPLVLWSKSDPELATVPDATSVFSPDNANDWRTEIVDLGPVADQPLILRIVSTNDYGNSLFLDHIGVIENNTDPPAAAITVSADTICRGDTITFEATSAGAFLSYAWNFGSQSFPNSASGPGPHDIRFIAPGLRLIRLIVTNPFGADTVLRTVVVRDLAKSNFSSSVSGPTVTFTNTSTNADDYLWDFGDGNSSTEKNPVHTYANVGAYTVKLTASSPCNSSEKTAEVTATVGVNEFLAQLDVRVSPNPTSGDFRVELQSNRSGDLRLTLTDAAGRQVKTVETPIAVGANTVRFDGLQLPAGIYQLALQQAGSVITVAVVVQ